MDETPQDLTADIEASLNAMPFAPDIKAPPGTHGLTGTAQLTITGLGSWLCTFKDGVHTSERCEGPCDRPPDATVTMSPDTYLRVVRQEGGLDAETAIDQGLITIDGDRRIPLAILGRSSSRERWWRSSTMH